MAIELHYNSAGSAVLEPIDAVATTAAAQLYAPDGQIVAVTLSPVLPVASTTTGAGTSAISLAVASASGFVVGQRVRVSSQGVRMSPKITRIDGNTLHLATSLSHD